MNSTVVNDDDSSQVKRFVVTGRVRGLYRGRKLLWSVGESSFNYNNLGKMRGCLSLSSTDFNYLYSR